jgi:glycosyltransferase involved in cell wall biosynthesis
MTTLLTIGIPTFNRAQLLDKQLAWLAQAIQGLESECEVIVSDNCSTDNTAEVIEKWRPVLSTVTLKSNKNSENIGAVRNIAYCINMATSKYVWTIGDDDPIQKQTLAYVLQSVSDQPDLALLILNFSKRDAKTNKINFERCFAIENDIISSDGKAVFERCLEERSGSGVALTTALVYRSDLAQRALQQWSSGLSNLLVQLYWTGFCALHGSVKVTKDNYLECTSGTHHFIEDKKVFLNLAYVDTPEVFVKLMKLGYSPRICRQLLLKQFRKYRWLISLIVKRTPVTTLHVLSRYLDLVVYVHYEIFKSALTKAFTTLGSKKKLTQT